MNVRGVDHSSQVNVFLNTVLSLNPSSISEAHTGLRAVPIEFNNFQQYVEVYQPLLLEEVRAQVSASLDSARGINPSGIRCCNDIRPDGQSNGGKWYKVLIDTNKRIWTNTIILLEKRIDNSTISAFGMVESSKESGANQIEVNIRFTSSANNDLFDSKINGTITIIILDQLSTITREFIAINNIENIASRDWLLGKRVVQTSTKPQYSISDKLRSRIESELNSSQMGAIDSTLISLRGVSMIQGAAGKTSTIVI